MQKQKPPKPSQFSESFQFIQSLFDQPESTTDRLKKRVKRISVLLLVAVALAGVSLLIWFLWTFQVEATNLNDMGINIPRR